MMQKASRLRRPLPLKKNWALLAKNNIEAATKIGSVIAERAKKAGVDELQFDRGGFLYHGKVAALAKAARENGLKF